MYWYTYIHTYVTYYFRDTRIFFKKTNHLKLVSVRVEGAIVYELSTGSPNSSSLTPSSLLLLGMLVGGSGAPTASRYEVSSSSRKSSPSASSSEQEERMMNALSHSLLPSPQ